MHLPLISVVLCTYNGDRFLKEQVESILGQTWQNLELVISDDASADETRSILQQFENDKRVRIYYQEKNIGLSGNFAFATSMARGEYISFSDQDDVWLPAKLEKLVAAISDHPLVYSDSLLTDEAGNSLGKKLSDLRNMYTGKDSRGYIFYNCVWGHGMMMKRNALEKCLPMPGDIHHDVWLAFKAFTLGGIVFHNEVLTLYRQHQGSSSKTLPQKTEPRSSQKRWHDFRKQLSWIEMMKENERHEYRDWYAELLRLYRMKEKGFSWKLFQFLMKNRKVIFMFSKKNYVSQVVEMLKQSRGERGEGGW